MTLLQNLPEQITAMNRRFMDAFASENMQQLAECYTEDAQLLVAHLDVIQGRGGIATVFRALRKHVRQIELTTRDLQGGEQMAIETGGYVQRGADGAVLDHGKFLVVWKREAEGWRIQRDMINTDLPKQAVPA